MYVYGKVYLICLMLNLQSDFLRIALTCKGKNISHQRHFSAFLKMVSLAPEATFKIRE